MGHTKAENDIAIEQIKKLNEIYPLKDYDVDSFVQGMRYGQSEREKQKLQFAIDQLESLIEIEHSDNFWYLENKILELKEQLLKLAKGIK